MSNHVEIIIITGGHWVIAKMTAPDMEQFLERLMVAAKNDEWVFWSEGAVRGSEVAGWYLRDAAPSPADRLAAAAEKLTEQQGEGEGWKS